MFMEENADSKPCTDDAGDAGSLGRSANRGGDEIVACLFSVSTRDIIASHSAVRSEIKLFTLRRSVVDRSVKS